MRTDPGPMAIEAALPAYDVSVAEHIVVDADAATTYQAVRHLDLLTIRTPLFTAAMWVRAAPARLLGRPLPAVQRCVVGDGGLPSWVVLGDVPDREFVVGAIGRFWQPVIEWNDVPDAAFRDFAEPGWGKIAANFSVRPYGAHATLLSYECRTGTTDPVSRRRFLRYWWLIRPFVRHVMRATVRKIKADAEVT